MFQLISSIRLPKSRFDHLKESQKSWQSLDELSRKQIEKGAQLDLAGKDSEITKQLFEWAAENLFQSDELIEAGMKYRQYNDIASWYLWRGYALIMLGRYEEAYDDLKKVVPYFTLNKKRGGETWQKLEYYLTKALIPLCEYILNPSDDNRKSTRKGIEEFIKSLKSNYKKQSGYLYYFHLKGRFPQVYGDAGTTSLKQSPAIRTSGIKPTKSLAVNIDTGENKYFVRMITSDDLLDGDIGSNSDLERYVEGVKSLGNFPVLSNLMDLYVGEGEQKPEPLVEECERLLSMPGLDEDLRKKTEHILRIAEKAKLYHLCLRIEYVDLTL